MRFHANPVSPSVSGDYCRVMFEAIEDSLDPDSPYLIIQHRLRIRAKPCLALILALEQEGLNAFLDDFSALVQHLQLALHHAAIRI